MSDEFEGIEGKNLSPKEAAYMNTVHQRKVVADAIKAGTLACLPGSDGYADTAPAVNLVNKTYYHGSNLLYSLHVSEKFEGTNNWEKKHIRLFNAALLNKLWEMNKWAEQKQEQTQSRRRGI
jgi:hypothetical protein